MILLKKNTGESAITGRSRCFSCGKILSWFELVPIFSFLVQYGKCRGCGSRISWQYPVVELATALLSLAIAIRLIPYDVSSYGFYFFAFCSLLLIAIYDFKHKIIDKHFLYIFGGFAVFEFALKHLNISTLISAAAVFLFFYFLWRISGGKWMGRGDSDLAFFLALFLGYPLSVIAILVSFWTGAVTGIFLLLLRPNKFTIKSEVPFGPFLAIGAFVAWFLKDFFTIIYEFSFF